MSSSSCNNNGFKEDLAFFNGSYLRAEPINLEEQAVEEKIANIVRNLEFLSKRDLLDIDESVKLKIFEKAIKKEGFSPKIRSLLSDSVFSLLLQNFPEKKALVKYCLRFENGVLKLLHNAYLSQEQIESVLSSFTQKEEVEELDLSGSEKLANLRFLKDFPSLRVLLLQNCRNLTALHGIEQVHSTLEKLDVQNCFNLKNLDSLSRCQKLAVLNAASCTGLESVGKVENKSGIAACSSLKELVLDRCNLLLRFNLNTLSTLTNLQVLRLAHLPFITDISWLSSFSNLQELDLSHTGISNAEALNHLPGLQVDFAGCRNLQKYPSWYQKP